MSKYFMFDLNKKITNSNLIMNKNTRQFII